jgi:O-antigen/teichoic acid export membrane protein
MRLRSAMLSSMLQQNSTYVLSFATGIVIARLISPREFGSYAVAMAVVNIAAAIKDFGAASYVISHPDGDDSLVRTGFGVTLATTSLLALAAVSLSWPLAALYDDAALGLALRIAACGMLAGQLGFPATVLLTRTMRFDKLLAAGLTGAFMQSAASLLLAAAGYGSTALATGFAVGQLATALCVILAKPDSLRLLPSLARAQQLLSFGGSMSATMIIGALALSAPEVLIGRLLGLGEAALFSRAQSIVSVIRNGLFAAIARPLLPALGALEAQGVGLAPLYMRVIESVTGLAWPAYVLLAIWAEPLIRLLYGPTWTGAAALVPPLAVAHGLTLAVAPHYDPLIVKRRTFLLLVCESGLFLCTLLALVFAVPRGLEVGAWALAATGGLLFAACYAVVLRRIVGFSALALAKVWARSLLLTLVVAPPALLLRGLLPGDWTGVLVGVGGSGLAGAVAWLTAVRLCGHELDSHLAPLLRRIGRDPVAAEGNA